MYQVFSRDYRYVELIKLGDQLLQEDLPFQAARTYESAINLSPNKELGYLKRAAAHQKQGDLKRALEDLLTVSEVSPDTLTVSLRLADIYHARGQFDDATTYYAKALALDPDSQSILYQLGMACFRAGRESEALEALTRAIEVQEDFFGAYYLRAAIHRSLGQDGEAESDYLKVLELRSESDEARSALIELHLENEDSVKAMKIVQEEIDRQPQEPTSYLHLADVHRLQGQHDEAIAAVGLALEQDPNLPQAYLQLGELWLGEGIRRGDHVALEKAVQALSSAAEMDPANGRAALALGRACLAIDDEERGSSELQRASEATPIQAEAHRLLGDIYQNRGNYAEAVTAYLIYLKLVGETPSVLERMGDAYSGMENFESAATTYLQVATLEPRRVLPFVKAARAWLAAGQPREAVRACRRGLSSSPENQILADLLAQATQPDAQAGPI